MKEMLKKTNKKTLIMAGSFLLLIFIIIFGGALLYNKLFYKVSYQEVENIMKKATIEYLENRPDKLPKNINDSITITEQTLVNAEKMKSISELIKDENTTCTGEIIITNINGNYRYNPILNCNDKYQNIKFTDYIKENISITETGNGLYNLNNELVYRGDNVDNYFKLSEKIYRIVKIKDDQVVLIYTDNLEPTVWDDRYNIERDDDSGINNYNVSRIKDYLANLYKETTLINDNDKLLITTHNTQIGKRNNNDTDKSGNLENSTVLENQYLSLLPVYDFLNASTDSNCTTTVSESCTNYNYLAKYNASWWLATGSSQNTYQVYKAKYRINLSTANSESVARVVVTLVKDAIYVSGNGTKENPYTVR